MRVLETATLQHHRSMNPCPVYDEFTGTLFLFFITVLGRTPETYQIVTGQNVTRLCCVTSADQGLSWSTATDLTQQVIGTTIKGTHPWGVRRGESSHQGGGPVFWPPGATSGISGGDLDVGIPQASKRVEKDLKQRGEGMEGVSISLTGGGEKRERPHSHG